MKSFLTRGKFNSGIRARALLVPLLATLLLFSLDTPPVHGQSDRTWHSHARVARRVMKKFKSFNTYVANFNIRTKTGRRVRNMRGRLYFKKPNKVRYEFTVPRGNLMVSNGSILWIYIRRLNAAGKQDLKLKKKNDSKQFVFTGAPGSGLTRLFRKYHYRFDKPEQPRDEGGRSVYVLYMTQRERIGGYENIKLYIDASTYLIRKAVAQDGDGKETEISFSRIRLNTPLDGSRFQFNVKNARVVDNPLVNK